MNPHVLLVFCVTKIQLQREVGPLKFKNLLKVIPFLMSFFQTAFAHWIYIINICTWISVKFILYLIYAYEEKMTTLEGPIQSDRVFVSIITL